MFVQSSIPASAHQTLDHATHSLSSFEHKLRVFDLTVELLIARANMGDVWTPGLDDAATLLASLPLPTSEFATASRHLQNAAAYCGQEEFGAAAFELRALRGQAQRL